MSFTLKCKCGNVSEAVITGQDSLYYEEGVKQHDIHDFSSFEFGFNDYNRTLVITCKSCNAIANILKTDGSCRHF